LLAGASQAIGKRLCDRIVGTTVAPEFVPKRNSELSGSRGLSADDAVRLEIGDEEVPSESERDSCFHVGAVVGADVDERI
jgi:hypothetical protein